MSGIDLASDMAENSNKLDAVFGGMSTNVRKSMKNISDDLKIGEVTLAKDFANIGAIMKGIGFDESTALTNTEGILKAAYDAASFHNLTFEDSDSPNIAPLMACIESSKVRLWNEAAS